VKLGELAKPSRLFGVVFSILIKLVQKGMRNAKLDFIAQKRRCGAGKSANRWSLVQSTTVKWLFNCAS
jgi:hypothetical protein